MQCSRTALSSDWQWRLVAASKEFAPVSLRDELIYWQPAKHSPSEIYLELLDRKLILDYKFGQNERKIQWVGKVNWEYKCSFKAPQNGVTGENFDLVFEGLDTFATVFLNGIQIAKNDNMFIPIRVDVSSRLLAKPGQSNDLLIVFESAEKRGTELEESWGKRSSLMRDRKRMNMRKAQYSWGWDWGPKILNAGPYLPIYLENYENRIENLFVTSTLSDDLSSAEVLVSSNFAEKVESQACVLVEIIHEDQVINSIRSVVSIPDKIQTTRFSISSPKIWWPHGHGEHPLYTVKVTLMNKSNNCLDQHCTQFGIRKIELIQRPLASSPGKTFMFRVNNKVIFIQGADWIPADNLLPTLTRERYFEWLEMGQKANLNMIRVWGGGFYETEDFWDACDQLGLLVWQDYMFACGDYPIHPHFLESIRQEAELQTLKFRNRASLALLCGGNEDFMFADWKTKYDHDDVTGPFENTSFPQRKIYLDILPKVAQRLAPNTPYWANSPWGGPTANDETIGDIHQWDVWHAKQLPYQDYHKLSGRFVSEFGMHGYPDMRTVDVFAPDPVDRHPQSQTIDCHNKGEGAEKRIARYMAENFRYTNDLEIYVYVSQLVQSEAYGYALRDWKRKYQGEGKEECAGAIIWQFNDCYPCTSWSFIDYYIRPKPAFYTIRRAFAPICIGIDRTPRSRFIDEDNPRDSEIPHFAVFAHSAHNEAMQCIMHIRAFDLFTGQYITEYKESSPRKVTLLPNQNTELGALENPQAVTEESLVILSASLVNSEGTIITRLVDWPEPFRYLQWPKDSTVKASLVPDSKTTDGWETIEIEANSPAKGCLLDVDGGEMPEWEDNMIDLLPGEKMSVRVRGLQGRALKVRWLNDWEQKK